MFDEVLKFGANIVYSLIEFIFYISANFIHFIVVFVLFKINRKLFWLVKSTFFVKKIYYALSKSPFFS